MMEDGEKSRRQCGHERLHEGGHYMERKAEATAIEETGISHL